MILVVDASAAVKWVVREAGHAEILERSAGRQRVAPDFVLVETANIFWKKVRKKEFDQQQAEEGYAFVRDAYEAFHPTASLTERAIRLAFEYNHPVYDCLYLACALEEKAELLTADRRLATVAQLASVPVSLITGDAP